jgi:Asparagine synthase
VQDLFESDLPAANGNRNLRRFLAFDQRYYLADDLLQKVDRMSMAHSLEVRPPYLDHRMIEFAASLPDRFKVSGRCHKLILKRLMRSKLPKSVLRRSKTGLDIPTHDWQITHVPQRQRVTAAATIWNTARMRPAVRPVLSTIGNSSAGCVPASKPGVPARKAKPAKARGRAGRRVVSVIGLRSPLSPSRTRKRRNVRR